MIRLRQGFRRRDVKDKILLAQVVLPKRILNRREELAIQGLDRRPGGSDERRWVRQPAGQARQGGSRKLKRNVQGNADGGEVKDRGFSRDLYLSDLGKIAHGRGKLKA